ncbi:putative annexin anxc4 [Golovinomyces cichoracearum]|uniref:Putative annexin anxc4 n=1 Tax=Golovinomyces cichoracearum TaxID=62708 RepID=A0A420HPG0_9PEZI|nr:putative annexin anxc4 [Golovinomyces cichoracearum]
MRLRIQNNDPQMSLSNSLDTAIEKNSRSQSWEMETQHDDSSMTFMDGINELEQKIKVQRVTANAHIESKNTIPATSRHSGIPLKEFDNLLLEPQFSVGLGETTFSHSKMDSRQEVQVDQQRPQYPHESRPGRLMESHKLFKAASLSIGERARHIIDGIHFNKNQSMKSSSPNESLDSSGSKPPKPDPLAYGEFSVDHLAYPKQLSDRNRIESSRCGAPHGSQPTQAGRPVEVASIRRQDMSLSSVGLTQRMPNFKADSVHFVGSRQESLVLDYSHDAYQPKFSMPSPLLNEMFNPPLNHNSCRSSSSVDYETAPVSNRKNRRIARFHDPNEEAKILAHALRDESCSLDTAPLISILPGLTHDQVLELRAQYKKLVRTEREKKGSNISKHIKLRLKNLPELMKACYVCSIGQWESESYWVTHYCKNSRNQPQFLIESLFGRTNKDIRLIKNGYRNKKYNGNLTQYLKLELNESNLKKAVMLVLKDTRLEEDSDECVNEELIDADVQELRNAIIQERGDEDNVIKVVALRRNIHLREVLRVYNTNYGENFAKEMLKKWKNTTGEILAHILNGVINGPVRDANLLHQALSLPRGDSLWSELLTSRLIRYHWDRPYFEQVRSEFRHLYDIELQSAVVESIPGDFGIFLEGLCVRRIEDDVRILPS